MNSNIIIRESKGSDSQAVYDLLRIIADLHKQGRPDMFPDLVSKYTVDEVKERLSNAENGVFVAEVEGNVVGYVFCEVISEGAGYTLYIDALCVDPDFRRMGVARMLMDKAKEYAKDMLLILKDWQVDDLNY